MNFKHFAVIFGVVLAIQASQQSPLEDDNLKSIAVPSYSKILRLDSAALFKADPIVTNLTSELFDMLAETIETRADDVIEEALDRVECINVAQNAFKKAAADLDDCEESVKIYKDILTGLMDNINLLIQDGIQVTIDLRKCKAGDLACLTTILQTSFDDLNSFYEAIENDQYFIHLTIEAIYIRQCVQDTGNAELIDIYTATMTCLRIPNV